MGLRAELLEARAWSALVALERLITDIEGVRGGPGTGLPSNALEPATVVPTLSAETLRERAPLLIGACVRVALDFEDTELVAQTRTALNHALEVLNAHAKS
jgi:hypothetical protein